MGMHTLIVLVALTCLCSVVPAALFMVNMRRFQLPHATANDGARVAVLIPARDEEAGIRACLEKVLASRGVELEAFVLDDNSSDRTAAIVRDVAAVDERVRLLSSNALPAGWNGKQHACWQLAQATDAPWMLFLDADVRVQPQALAGCVGTLRDSRVALLSGFPRQITHSFLEWLLLPMIHFVLLAYLPLGRMRKTSDPAYAAGCGQFMLVERDAYMKAGGHAAIRETRHDGLRLPRLFRAAGFYTDITDLTHLASVRMYSSASAVWNGLAKNATEGMGSPTRIVPFTLLLAFGAIGPIVALVWSMMAVHEGVAMNVLGRTLQPIWLVLASSMAVCASFLPRLLATRCYEQPFQSALLHPLGVLLLLCIQWYALVRQLLGRPVDWRARQYSTVDGSERRG